MNEYTELDAPTNDTDEYLPCGCHRSQPEHSCRDDLRNTRRSRLREMHAHHRRQGVRP